MGRKADRRIDRSPTATAVIAVVVALSLVLLPALGPEVDPSAADPASAPTVAWARLAGGAADDQVGGVAVGPDGTTFVGGTFAGRGRFGVGSGAITRTTAPTTAAFVAAHDATGDLRWVRAATAQEAVGLSIDDRPGGGTVLVGAFRGELRLDDGPVLATSTPRRSLFVLALDVDGNPDWVRTATAPSHDSLARHVAVGADGTVVVTGDVRGTLDLGLPGAPLPLTATPTNPWLAAYGPDGTPRWARTLPSTGGGSGIAVAVHGDGTVVAGGSFVGAMPASGLAPALTAGGVISGYVVAVGADGVPRWARSVGNQGTTWLADVDVDADGAVALAALTVGVTGALGSPLPDAGAVDGLVATVDLTTGGTRWVAGLAGPGADGLLGVQVEPSGAVVAVGGRSPGATAWSTGPGPVPPPVGTGALALVRWAPDGAVVADAALDAGIGRAVAGEAGRESVVSLTSTPVSSGGRTFVPRGGKDAVVLALGPTVNRPPVAADVSLHASPDHPRPVEVRAEDPDGDPLVWQITDGPDAGSVSGTLPLLTYQPAPGATGIDTFTATASDGRGASADVVVQIDVGANDPPLVVADPVVTTSGQAVAVPISATDADGDPVTLSVVQAPAHGTLRTAGDPWELRPPPGWVGTDVVVVAADDGVGGRTEVTIDVQVVAPGANRPPRRAPAPATTTTATRTVTVDLGIDDADGDPVALSLTGVPALGTATLDGGRLTYQPAGALGTDVLAVTAEDGAGGSTTFDVVVHVKRPNVVVVLTDDQTLEQLRWTPGAASRLAANGTTFADAVVSYSECCPSRATLLTGRYAHNHGVLSSAPPTGGIGAFDDTDTLATWLDGAGYDTTLAGKYLNGYGTTVPPSYVPPGWDDWLALAEPAAYEYLGGRLSDDGTVVDLPADADAYTTDLLADHVVGVIEEHEGSATPFFALYAPIAPHVADGRGIAVPAPRHQAVAAGATAPRGPAFDEADSSDKPAALRRLPRLTTADQQAIDTEYRAAAGSLAAVDEAVVALWDALEATGQREDTLVVLTSDNGFHHGEHRIRTGKSTPYEEAIRVPLLVAGPGFPAGTTATQPVANVDLAPTVAAVAGVGGPAPLDGIDLRGVAADPARARNRLVLVENGPLLGRPLHWGVRDQRWVYIQWSTGEKELYDRLADPGQLVNLARSPSQALRVIQYAAQAKAMRSCVAAACHRGV